MGGEQVEWSDEACELYDVPAGTVLTLEAALAFHPPEWRTAVREAIERCARGGTSFDIEVEIGPSAAGDRRWVRSIGNALRDASGVITHVHGSVQDITAKKIADARHEKLEAQLRQAQKMETVGSLAAGVAHDFNNLMSIVLTFSELLAEDMAPDDPRRADLDEFRGAGQRVVDLTGQLLAFSRQQVAVNP